MDRGLFIAASGMLAAQIRQDVIANNLANATNPGFKADSAITQSFADMLLYQSLDGHEVGKLSSGVEIADIAHNLRQGSFRITQNPLDVAIGGDGWFTVRTQAGTAYTRNGAFTTNAQGQLCTQQGDPVLGTNGQPIVLGHGGKIGIDKQGHITLDGRAAGQLQITLLDPRSIKRMGDNYLRGTATAGAPGQVLQGTLEASNVNTVKEMVSLIENMRGFEANQRAVHALDDTLDKAVNQVGRV